ncbi:hypothetical protein V5799_026713 [Amblyomma americanum]|uniref:Uncharacterized protein n=1 Tax=Amblyomma americanum TaxID=6943 RepID=A0AAQ4DHT1_AMBAM
MEIDRADEDWMKDRFQEFNSVVTLAQFYASFLRMYDPTLNAPRLATRITRAESTVTPRSTLDAAREMAMNLVRELINKLSTTAWIRDPVRKFTLRKARALRLIMGYPNELANESLVDAFYAHGILSALSAMKPNTPPTNLKSVGDLTYSEALSSD